MFTQLQLASFVLFYTSVQGLSYPGSFPAISTRVAVVRNELSTSPSYFAFMSNPGATIASKGLIMGTSEDGKTWSEWSSPLTSDLPLVSNPVALTSYVASIKKKLIFVFMQNPKGQLSALVQNQSDPKQFELQAVTSDLPVNLDFNHQSPDPVQAVIGHDNQTYLFVRTLSNTSHVYWNRFNGTLNFANAKWKHLEGSGSLTFDPCVAVNTFLGRVEVFGVFDDNHVHHTWQDGSDSFSGGWQKLGGPFSPTFNSAPVAHQMGHSDFNGVLNLFVRGSDGSMHHISQTTCDKVKNVWGPCTWGVFQKVGGGPPPYDMDMPNPFTVSHSIHLGIEIFSVGKDKGQLFRVWQSERDSSYSDWENLGLLPNSSPLLTSPAILIGESGWWEGFALNSTHSLAKFTEKPLEFSLSPNAVEYGTNVTVTWKIPHDQATHMDWIGVYPWDADGHGYVDYSYVGGRQNPLKDPVPKGTLEFLTTLPNGVYNYRYMPNKAYDPVFNHSVKASGYPVKSEWVFLFDGISRGLGGFDSNVSKCADDGDRTVETFQAAFTAFEDREIFKGLHLFADGLTDFRDALVQCNETYVVDDLVVFIEALVSCTEDYCAKFAYEIALELVIFYEHEYEIYGDIQGATNSFKIKAYEQGGVCVGRVTYACLTIE